jgi:hypothetical protein
MKVLHIPFVPFEKSLTTPLPLHPIDIRLWNSANDRLSSTAAFTISHYNVGLYVHFFVTEPFLKARKREAHGQVHKDNCVELFFRFDHDANYYNFEFNCLGSIKAAYGRNRVDRKYLPIELIRIIEENTNIHIANINEQKLIQWEIAVALPLDIFHFHKLTSLAGSNSEANFAKCGDDLPMPHFLSWVDIPTTYPDFHQPSAFGKVHFAGPVLVV